MSLATNSTTIQTTANTALQRERETFRILRRRLVDGILNRIFALTIKGSRQRRGMLAVLFMLIGPIVIFSHYPWSQWELLLQDLFSAIFRDQSLIGQSLINLFHLVEEALLNPHTLRYIPIVILPYIFSIHQASRYLSDIFELKDFSIARKFISEVSLGGADNYLTISAAEIKQDEIEKSPIIQIGGPGRVTVELDTAILVERPDGRLRVIGPTHDDDEEDETSLDEHHGRSHLHTVDPTHKMKRHGRFPGSRKRKNKAVLEGFERIREMVDLRDQIPDAMEITTRSKDGVPISISDVRVVFSIFRDKKVPTTTEPHPFTEEAIQTLVYNEIHPVIEGKEIHRKWFQSGWEPIWLTAMKSLLRRELGIFMGTRNLRISCQHRPPGDRIGR
jgi:hypothetical protein